MKVLSVNNLKKKVDAKVPLTNLLIENAKHFVVWISK